MAILATELNWNQSIIDDFHAHGGQITEGRLAGSNTLLMTSVGAKSGLPRTTPLGYSRDRAAYIVAGSNSGKDVAPKWLANVAADPIVTVEVGTETFKARATQQTGAERDRLWAIHTTAIPRFVQYEGMTERTIPVVTIERLPAD
ncbi:MAG: nitroreductase/quinone reductase family protein [Candidatus Limnocylindrales bacterium]